MAHDLRRRTGLYFKINVMKMIRDVHPQPRRVDMALNKLLDINFRVLLAENHIERVDESILPYLNESVHSK